MVNGSFSSYKLDDATVRHAFSVLFLILMQRGQISVNEAYHTLSGVRLNGSSTSKIPKTTVRSLVRRWHRLRLITLYKGKVRPCYNQQVFRILDSDIREQVLQGVRNE
jgi:hypothetical protein